MRKFWGLAVFVWFNMALVGSASADSALQVVVHAEVAPARYIILSSNNQISEIISNTPLPVTPQVYAGSVTNGHQRPLTTALYTEYLFLVNHATSDKTKIGILYKADSHQQSNESQSAVATISDKSSSIHHLFFLKPFGSLFHV